jgi:hypothetical protein
MAAQTQRRMRMSRRPELRLFHLLLPSIYRYSSSRSASCLVLLVVRMVLLVVRFVLLLRQLGVCEVDHARPTVVGLELSSPETTVSIVATIKKKKKKKK